MPPRPFTWKTTLTCDPQAKVLPLRSHRDDGLPAQYRHPGSHMSREPVLAVDKQESLAADRFAVERLLPGD